VVITNGGVSNFGNYRSTVILYVAGFSLCIIFLCQAAWLLFQASLRKGAVLIVLLSILILAVLLSTFPRHISYGYSELHDYLGIALYQYELGLSIWFIARFPNRFNVLTFIVEVIGSLVGLLSIVKVIHFLFVGQIIGGIAYGILFIRVLPAIIEAAQKRRPTPS
jgi:hypothetical protein